LGELKLEEEKAVEDISIVAELRVLKTSMDGLSENALHVNARLIDSVERSKRRFGIFIFFEVEVS